jgi:hypothetical protein
MEPISFVPDVASLAIADKVAAETGKSLEEIAGDAFSAYMDSVREDMAVEADRLARDR